MLFDEPTLRKLNQLTLVAARLRAGMIKGERRSTKRGTSIEFADYRDYTRGDDLRRLDWNVYARLDRPFIKLLEEEEDLAVHVLVDASRSMDWGEGETHKLHYALHLAGALGAIALGAGDNLAAQALRQTGPSAHFGPARGPQQLGRYLHFLETLISEGPTDVNDSLRDYSLNAQRPGLAFFISDLFSPSGWDVGLKALLARGYEVTLIHLLSPDEIDPPLAGDLRLVDVETGQIQEVSIDAGMRAAYRQRLLDWRESIQAECRKRSVRYLGLSTSMPWDKVILYEMRKTGIIK